jgi:hypothetical protein
MATSASGERGSRLAGLRRFALGITVINILGHLFLGFEASWAHPLVGLATAYSVELVLELVEAWAGHRPPAFAGGLGTLVDFLLSAHITGLAIAMLMYPNEQLWPVAFAVAVALGSKRLFRAPVGKGSRHFLNPSNFGISLTILLFPWVAAVAPWQFTENIGGAGDVILPLAMLAIGTMLNARFTGRLPLIAGWASAYAIQAVLRCLIAGTPIAPALLSITGPAFILFTLYMVTDPATTPSSPRGQVAFSAAVAAVYGVLVLMHIVFALFFALTIVCALRGLGLYAQAWAADRAGARGEVRVPAQELVGRPTV